MAKTRTVFACTECGQHQAQWGGRCPGCGAWGTVEAARSNGTPPGGGSVSTAEISALTTPPTADVRVPTGSHGIDRVLGGGIVPASVLLLAGEPGIGKSTLLLQVAASLASRGHGCLIASGEESHAQVSARAARLGLDAAAISFTGGRELPSLIDAARAARPFLLAVDSIQSLRDPASATVTGGPTQVRGCADALVGLAKSEGITVLMTGHVTKDGDLAGPRTLEHAVDVVLSFEGDPRSGQRVLAGGKNRFGSEGEMAWFEMGLSGLTEADPAAWLAPGEREVGAATALPLAGRRALAVEVQALAVPGGSGRRQATGLDAKRFSLVAAVVDRGARVPLATADLYGASSGGVRLDDPGCDLAVAAALVSAATGTPPPDSSAFVGELSLTGVVRSVPGMGQRVKAARARGIRTVFAPVGEGSEAGVVPVARLSEAVSWASRA